MGRSVGSERLGDVEKTTELKDVARWEDEEASVEALGFAVFPASELGDEEAGDDEEEAGDDEEEEAGDDEEETGDDEEAGVAMTRPIIGNPCSKSGPLQHPGSPSLDNSFAPQHQLTV